MEQKINSLNKYNLNNSVQYLKSVGPKKAKLLGKLGIFTIYDLLHYYPRDWEDRATLKTINQLKYGDTVTIKGTVKSQQVMITKSRLNIFRVKIEDGTGTIEALWFRPFTRRYDVFATLKKHLVKGQEVLLYGTVEPNFGATKELIPTLKSRSGLRVEEYELFSGTKDDLIHTGRIVPVYPLTENVKPQFFRALVYNALRSYTEYLDDILPNDIKNNYQLINKQDAIRNIHFPDTWYKRDESRRRLVFEEFFVFQLVLEWQRSKRKQKPKSQRYEIKRHLLTPFKEKLLQNFDFTGAQKKVINEIFANIQSVYPMNRLLQGDVGSGKTVVALCAILLAIENGYQTAFMAPTEILAEQHYMTLKQMLVGLPVEIALLTNKTTAKERETLFTNLADGKTSVLIGTHAVLEEKVKFARLSLIVVDEQHRFGVMQRARLVTKGDSPDVLVMTATPIPRTLALTLYGDLEVSVLDELPSGRQKIVTLHYSDTQAYSFVKNEIESGHQAYIVYPLVEESDKVELKSAVQEAKHLQKDVFPQYHVGLIHGQMKGKDKEKIMLDFRNHKYDILIATTVIEVGIDVPNATVMVIEHCERFGLATLHQLRGRVGRSSVQSHCLLLGKPGTEYAKRRIDTMLATNDGFEIAEEDLKLRGPGEFFGTAQHGLPAFKIADLVSDNHLLPQTLTAVKTVLSSDPDLTHPENQKLKKYVQATYRQKIVLSRVG